MSTMNIGDARRMKHEASVRAFSAGRDCGWQPYVRRPTEIGSRCWQGGRLWNYRREPDGKFALFEMSDLTDTAGVRIGRVSGPRDAMRRVWKILGEN